MKITRKLLPLMGVAFAFVMMTTSCVNTQSGSEEKETQETEMEDESDAMESDTTMTDHSEDDHPSGGEHPN